MKNRRFSPKRRKTFDLKRLKPNRLFQDLFKKETLVLVGKVQMKKKGLVRFSPIGPKPPSPVALLPPFPKSLEHLKEPVVVVRNNPKLSTSHLIKGNIETVLGPIDDPKIDSWIVIYRNGLPRTFPEEVLKETHKIDFQLSPAEVHRRKDLRHLPFVTIDGADARDHDDAIALDPEGKVWVAIADVSHYVSPHSSTDEEAAARGNSYYFPDLVLPMLPEKLSNQICSLVPEKDRLCLAVSLEVSNDGKLGHVELFEAIIQSRARLTYEGVYQALSSSSHHEVPTHLLPMLEKLSRLSEKMFRKRLSEGGIDFDLCETQVVLNTHGEVEALNRRERTPAQRIIEELMLAANKGVALILSQADYPSIYRVHERPDPKKLEDFLSIVRSYGFKATLDPFKADPHELDRLLKQFKNVKESKVFSSLTLRSMRQAFYSPQNIGHYGLGFSHYLHFTSPIRRYADLVVHRITKSFIHQEATSHLFPKTYGTLENIALHISSQERLAQMAEREIRQLKGIRFLEHKIGKVFRGTIVGMIPKGIFVELEDHSVEGFVSAEKFHGDQYWFMEREMMFRGRKHGENIKLGQEVIVSVDEVIFSRARINFSLRTRIV